MKERIVCFALVLASILSLSTSTFAISDNNGEFSEKYTSRSTRNYENASSYQEGIFVVANNNVSSISLKVTGNIVKSSNDSSETVDFGTDYNQELVYDGLVRAVANSTASGKYLWGKDCSLGISANHYSSTSKTYSSHRVAYSFTGYSLL